MFSYVYNILDISNNPINNHTDFKYEVLTDRDIASDPYRHNKIISLLRSKEDSAMSSTSIDSMLSIFNFKETKILFDLN